MDPMQIVSQRLGKIEESLGKLTDAFVTIARTEERVFTLIKDQTQIENELDKLKVKYEELDRHFNKKFANLAATSRHSSGFIKTIERVLWILFAAALSWLTAWKDK